MGQILSLTLFPFYMIRLESVGLSEKLALAAMPGGTGCSSSEAILL